MKIFCGYPDVNVINRNYNNGNKRVYFGNGAKLASLCRDGAELTAKKVPKFDCSYDAAKYFIAMTKKVNDALKEEDEPTAFDLLGYDIDTDFETGKITVNGDYKPFFTAPVGHYPDKYIMSYKEAGIKEEELLKNVEKITGKRYLSKDIAVDGDSSYLSSIYNWYSRPDLKNMNNVIISNRTDRAGEALKENNSKKALELLGFKTAVDAKGNITIKGDYSALLFKGKKLSDYGISESELLKNVVEIQGSAEFQSDYKPDHYIKIHKDLSLLSLDVDEKIKMEHSLLELSGVKEALNEGKSKKALQILGYKTFTDKDGNITIKGNYSANFLDLDFDACGIDENKLLESVVKIDGNADFGKSFKPDHFIEIPQNRIVSQAGKDEEINIRKEFAKILTNGDTSDICGILKAFGYDAVKDETGSISVLGDLNLSVADKFGIPQEEFMKNIHLVNGDLIVTSETGYKPNKDLSVTGYIRSDYLKDFDLPSLFSEFSSSKDVAKKNGISEASLLHFLDKGVIHHDFRTEKRSYGNTEVKYYFKDDSNKEFFEKLAADRDKLVSTEELCTYYNISPVAVRNAIKEYTLTPWGLDNFNRSVFCQYVGNTNGAMFDIESGINKMGLAHFEEMKTAKQKEFDRKSEQMHIDRQYDETIKWAAHPAKAYPLSALERLGYGSKADLVANCSATNAYQTKRYIMDNDKYDISGTIMLDILKKARNNNPAIVKALDLKRILGLDNFRKALANNSIFVISKNPEFTCLQKQDYYVDLSDEKNQEFIRTVDDGRLNDWLDTKLEEYKQYKAKNLSQYEELGEIRKIDDIRARQLAYLKYIRKIEAQKLEEEQKLQKLKKTEQTQTKQKKPLTQAQLAARKNSSLLLTVAWALNPDIREVLKQKTNKNIREIINKDKEIRQIRRKILIQEISLEDVQARLDELKLTKAEKIQLLGYFKSCWKVTGSDEWKNALHNAKEIANEYKQNGLSGVKDEAVRERLMRWEQEWSQKF